MPTKAVPTNVDVPPAHVLTAPATPNPAPYTPTWPQVSAMGMTSTLIGNLWPIALIFIALAVIGAAMRPKRESKERPRPKRPLTEREQAMYFRLTQALPNHVVLAQVAFSAVLEAKSLATRNTFNRKVADFVICKKSFDVVALIELDDASHSTRWDEDRQRDALLKQAGYPVIRFPNVPDVEDVLKALRPLTPTQEASPR